MTLTALGILAFCAILSFLSFRNTFFGLKLISGMSWFVLMMYFKDNPPTSIPQGSPVHIGILILCIGFGLMIVLAGLAKGTKTNKTIEINGVKHSVESEGFHIPDWLKNATSEDLTPEEMKNKRDQSLLDYRKQFHNALHQGRK